MDKKEKTEKQGSNSKEIESLSDFLSFEYYDWRIKSLADKIKLENYRPRRKIYNF